MTPCRKTYNTKIQNIYHKALKIILNSKRTCEELQLHSNGVPYHQKN